jgi:hypothetical protein
VQIDVIDNIASGFDIVDDSALVAATVRLGRPVFQTKRRNEAIRMADLKAQSPSHPITMRFCLGGRHQGDCVLRRAGRARSVGILRSGETEILRRTVAATVMRRSGRFPALAQTRAAL